MKLVYVDTSALAKVVKTESGSSEMIAKWSNPELTMVSSALTITELLRAAKRHGLKEVRDAQQVLAGLVTVAVSREILSQAGLLDPELMSSLDSIHLATALAIGSDLYMFVTSDERLGTAAEAHGLEVEFPS